MSSLITRMGVRRLPSSRAVVRVAAACAALSFTAFVPCTPGQTAAVIDRAEDAQRESVVLSATSVPPLEERADVNKDRKVSSIDLSLASRFDPRADVNLDGKVSSIDLSQIAQVMARQYSSPIVKRDKHKQPFASNSPWNMPIGSGAVYVPAGIAASDWVVPEINYVYTLRSSDPVRSLFHPANWGQGRCDDASEYEGIDLPLPDALVVPDAEPDSTPNNAAAFLLPDGQTYVQVNALARCVEGGPVFGIRGTDQSIYGQGIRGSQGGSGLSSVGGTLRVGELTGAGPIVHALKVTIWCERYCSYTDRGYRWPATRSDAYASPETYGGAVPALRMGSLLAIPPSMSLTSLGLETDAGAKLFRAFQDYGAYVVDDAYWDAHGIAIEHGALEEFEEEVGAFAADRGRFYRDVQKLFQSLHVVDNNTPETIGGGGTPRQPLAPPIGN